MEQKTLTPEQVITIVRALMGVEPNLQSRPIIVEMAVVQIESVPADTMEIVADLHVTRIDPASGPIDSDSYQLTIGYYVQGAGVNPSAISLSYLGKDSLHPILLGNLVFVTDKLREYGIW